jgi:phage I-like protein
MSVTLAERERWRLEFDRANAVGWANEMRKRVEAIQASHPGMSFERAWDKEQREQENPPAEPMTIGEAAKLVQAQNPTWSFEKSWSQAKAAVYPELDKSSTAEESRVVAKFAPRLEREKLRTEARIEAVARQLMARDSRMTFGAALCEARAEARAPKVGQHPAIARELELHRQLGESDADFEKRKYAKLLAEVRKLMGKDSSLTFNAALLRAEREHPELKPAADGEPAAARSAAPIPIGSLLVTAEAAVSFDGLPGAIQYMPAGRSTICPSVNGVAKEIDVTVTPSTAAALQADLSKLLSQNVRPFIDFDHEGGRAAATPKRFFWKDGEGVMLELDWTGAGKTAIAGRDYSHFSATFIINKDGDLINLPSSGAIGSLVNNPAFRSGKRLTAAAYGA